MHSKNIFGASPLTFIFPRVEGKKATGDEGNWQMELPDPRRSRIVTRGTGELENCHRKGRRQKNQLNRQMENSS